MCLTVVFAELCQEPSAIDAAAVGLLLQSELLTMSGSHFGLKIRALQADFFAKLLDSVFVRRFGSSLKFRRECSERTRDFRSKKRGDFSAARVQLIGKLAEPLFVSFDTRLVRRHSFSC